ncbi:MAG: hypothetical protein ACFB0E_02965 [Leptolyngbyaceae cyanobacterium]
MRFLISTLGLSTLLSSGLLAAPLATVTELRTQPAAAQFLLAQASTGDEALTLLRFETQHYLVRVYLEGGLTYLNVYNKETGFTDQNGVLAYLIEPEDEDSSWRIYANQQGDLEYRAMVNPEGDTALEIRLPDGPPAQPEYGYDATYSFPHIFLGEALEATLSTLEESGWSVESTSSERVELTRNQLALALKFDPETKVITYTQLSDEI